MLLLSLSFSFLVHIYAVVLDDELPISRENIENLTWWKDLKESLSIKHKAQETLIKPCGRQCMEAVAEKTHVFDHDFDCL
jgi:hypothetical protein